MKKPLALVDLDGTLADFAGAMRRDLAKLKAPEEPELQDWDDNKLPPHIKARWDLIKRQPNWWFNLEYLESGQFLVRTLQEVGYRVHILTRGPRKLATAWEQKVEWVLKNVPGAEITIAPNKSMVYGKLLVDDWPDYVLPWLEHRPRGIVILPDQPWNRTPEINNHPQIYRHVYGKNDDQIRLALMAHLKRLRDQAGES